MARNFKQLPNKSRWNECAQKRTVTKERAKSSPPPQNAETSHEGDFCMNILKFSRLHPGTQIMINLTITQKQKWKMISHWDL